MMVDRKKLAKLLVEFDDAFIDFSDLLGRIGEATDVVLDDSMSTLQNKVYAAIQNAASDDEEE